MTDAPRSAAPVRRPLLTVVRPLLYAGWAIAAVRLLLDAFAPDASMYFGLYYGLPVVLLVLGSRGAFDDLSWGRLSLAMILTALLVWAPMDAVAYVTGQFAGWTHGRFAADRAPPLRETAAERVAWGAVAGVLTSIAGSVWMVAAGTLLVWLPRRVGLRRSRAAA